MSNTESTFANFYAAFQRDYYLGMWKGQRYGQAFTDALYLAGKYSQAHSLIGTTDDPFYDDTVSEDTKAFLTRVWDWPNP